MLYYNCIFFTHARRPDIILYNRFLLAGLLIFLTTSSYAQETTPTLQAGLEPAPPLITDQNTGYSVEWLKEVAEAAGFDLTIQIMPYSRAKSALMTGQVDIIGHTPHGLETDAFYTFASELDYSVMVSLDAVSVNEEDIQQHKLDSVYVGTPFGNASFISELLNLTEDRFVEGTLPNVVNMMLARRINTVVFERAAILSQVQKHQASVYYRQVKQISAGFAIRSDNPGLLARLNDAALQIDSQAIYEDYFEKFDWPDEGFISFGDVDVPDQK